MFVLYFRSVVTCLIFYLVPSCGIHLSPLDAELVSSEYEALYDLYNATNGQLWTLPDYWGPKWDFSSGSDPCIDLWQGVECAQFYSTSGTEIYHITGLYLFEGNLRGYLPNSVGTFSKLNHLDLSINKLNGTLPDSIGELSELLELYLFDNKLSGWLPTSLGSLSKLTYLDASQNVFNGTIPATLGNLSQLADLLLNENALSGHIPSVFGNLLHLISLHMDDNFLTGTIPGTFGNLSSLQTLRLDVNRLHGPIPSTIGGMVNLNFLALNENSFSGRIPDSFCNISRGWLAEIFLNDNLLSGPLPACLGRITELYQLELRNNHLTGPLPHSVGLLTELTGLDVRNNHLSGWLPEEMCSMIQVFDLRLSDNSLSGPIPACLDNMTQLSHVDMTSNFLTGSIPTSLGIRAMFINVMYLDSNFLTGTLPRLLGNSSVSNWILQVFDAHRNFLTGPIPASLIVSNALEYVDVSTNFLSHTIPSTFSTNLLYLILSHNAITGSLPITLRNCTSLGMLNVQNNRLTGDLDGRFEPSPENSLITLQLDNNQFSGTLPAQLFALPNLRTLTLAASCFVGTLPDNICSAVTMQSLILYGLHTGASCRKIQVINTLSSFADSFPSCLLGLPAITTLILSANHLTGSISQNATVAAHFQVLDLSHNALSGSLPSILQEHPWYNLDLSHNKFVGSLGSQLFQVRNLSIQSDTVGYNVTQAEITARRALSLTGNRLSGSIPPSLLAVRNISVLSGNLLSCKYDKSDLPQHDHYEDVYACASNEFDAAFYVWSGLLLLGVVLLGVAVGFKYNRVIEAHSMELQLPGERDGRLTNLHRAMEACRLVARYSGWSALVIVAIFTPAYALISYFAGTHEQQYAYVVSTIYAGGTAAFVVNFALWTVLLCAVYIGFLFAKDAVTATATATKAAVADAGPSRILSPAEKRAVVYIWVTYIVVNLAIVLGVNIAFVYVVLYQSSQLQTFAAVLLSVFKIVWNTVCAPYLLRWIVAAQAKERGLAQSVEAYFNLQLAVSLYNTIAIPCLVVAGIDQNCFSEVLLTPTSKTVSYLMFVCTYFQPYVGCKTSTQQVATVELTPPFTYSYQCSASFVTSYATTFIFMAISTTFVEPMLMYALWWLHTHLQRGSRTHSIVEALLPNVLLPLPIKAGVSEEPVRNWMYPVFDANDLLVNLLTCLSILLTFGVVFTPIAAAMAVAIFTLSYTNLFHLRRFILKVIAAPQLGYLDIVDAECAPVGSRRQLQQAGRIVVCCCCAFYTLFLFDTLGDAEGFPAAVWVLFVVPLAPYVLFACQDAHTYSTGWMKIKGDGPVAEGCAAESVPVEVELATWDMEQLGTAVLGDKIVGDAESTLGSVDVVNKLHADFGMQP